MSEHTLNMKRISSLSNARKATQVDEKYYYLIAARRLCVAKVTLKPYSMSNMKIMLYVLLWLTFKIRCLLVKQKGSYKYTKYIINIRLTMFSKQLYVQTIFSQCDLFHLNTTLRKVTIEWSIQHLSTIFFSSSRCLLFSLFLIVFVLLATNWMLLQIQLHRPAS